MTNSERQAWEKGVRVAADVASTYDHLSSHPFRVSDCILGKLNLLPNSKIRRTPKRTRRKP